MNIDDLLCVGATDNILVSSTIGRNKNLIPGEVIAEIINGTEALLEKLRSLGVNAHLTGGETADVGDLVRTIIVDSTVTCRMKRSDVISNDKIQPGDVVVGLSSSGKAIYEDGYNGGMGSNGLTSARHDIFAYYLAEKYPESYDASMPTGLAYSGTKKLTDEIKHGCPAGHRTNASGYPRGNCRYQRFNECGSVGCTNLSLRRRKPANQTDRLQGRPENENREGQRRVERGEV